MRHNSSASKIVNSNGVEAIAIRDDDSHILIQIALTINGKCLVDSQVLIDGRIISHCEGHGGGIVYGLTTIT